MSLSILSGSSITTYGILAVALFQSQACAQFFTEMHVLHSSGGAGTERFGFAVDIDQGVIAASAYDQSPPVGDIPGNVFLFDAATGAQTMVLTPDDGLVDGFGVSVAISGNIVAVGAMLDDTNGMNAGAVYLFDASTGAQLAKLFPDDASDNDWFGASVALDGDTLAVGSPYNEENGLGSGGVYLFDVTTMTQVAKVFGEPHTGVSNFDLFGGVLALSGDRLAVGVRNDDDRGNNSGAVWLFEAPSGQLVTKITPSFVQANEHFGESVDIKDGLLVVGSPQDQDLAPSAGSASFLRATDGVFIRKFYPDDPTSNARFGSTVAVDESGLVVIGSIFDFINAGSAYIFSPIGNQAGKLVASASAPSRRLGSAMAVSNGIAAVGAVDTEVGGVPVGAVYVFEVDMFGCPADTNLDLILSPADFTAWIAAFNAQSTACDQNGDSLCTPADFTAWIANYNAGC